MLEPVKKKIRNNTTSSLLFLRVVLPHRLDGRVALTAAVVVVGELVLLTVLVRNYPLLEKRLRRLDETACHPVLLRSSTVCRNVI